MRRAWVGVGFVVTVIGSFLPWLSAGDTTVSGFKIPLTFALFGSGASSALRVGIVTVVLALIPVLPFVMSVRVSPNLASAAAGLVMTCALLAILWARSGPTPPTIELGAPLTFLGGALILVSEVRQ